MFEPGLRGSWIFYEVVTNVEIFQWYKHSFVLIIGTNCYEDLLLKFSYGLHYLQIRCKFKNQFESR